MANLRQKIPSIIRKDPVTATILSKLTATEIRTPVPSTVGMLNIPTISASTHDKIKNNEDILKLFPDVEICIQILVSSIISPNDMTLSKINLEAPSLKLPPAIKSSIMEAIESHIVKNYDYVNKLPQILRETLFTKGAYIEAVIPEASLDDIISQTDKEPGPGLTIEEYYAGKTPIKGYLGGNNLNITIESNVITKIPYEPNKQSVLSFSEEDLGVVITDNYQDIRMYGKTMDNVHKEVNKKLSTETGSFMHAHINNQELDTFFRDVNTFTQQEYVEIKEPSDATRKSIGSPLIFKMPVEAVIPVHVINDPSKHLGYFMIVNEHGIPLTNFSSSFTKIWSDTDTITTQSSFIQKTKNAMYGVGGGDTKLENLEELYGSLVDSIIRKKLESGMYGELADIKENADIYRVMFFRALKAQRTKLVFIPAELVTYYAFEYRENGTGKSLMEKNAVLYSLRAILLYARTMAAIKNTTNMTEISVNLDEHDTDPERTREMVISEVLKSRQNMLPIGNGRLMLKAEELADWTHKAGMRFKFQHPGLPEMDISSSTDNLNVSQPDDELERTIREYIFNTYGLTPEIVESGIDSDFATTVMSKNILTAKRITRLQEMFNDMLTKNIRKILRNDITLAETIENIINNNKGEIAKFVKKTSDGDITSIPKKELNTYITNIFINETMFFLPAPQATNAAQSKEALESFEEMANKVCEIFFNAEILPEDLYGVIGTKMETFKNMFKASLVMNYIQENNYLPKITDFLSTDDAGKPIFEPLEHYEAFANRIEEAATKFLKNRTKGKRKLEPKLKDVIEELEKDTSEAENQEAPGQPEGQPGTDDTQTSDAGGDTKTDETPDAKAPDDDKTETKDDAKDDKDKGGKGDTGDFDFNFDFKF